MYPTVTNAALQGNVDLIREPKQHASAVRQTRPHVPLYKRHITTTTYNMSATPAANGRLSCDLSRPEHDNPSPSKNSQNTWIEDAD
jgi:hypothetical protein